ncbi:HAMP domain-containing sensor histidine kinase [Nocardioides sp.]|uniref:sensor histidine kinase n=1 Tax=Nocardioides sp. TaxID=35761 RepID=UPI00261AA312|nr:HAMP domain-containing sensor histidine kinase [Nocardioides sp.]
MISLTRWRDRLSLRAQLVSLTALLAVAVAAGLVLIVQFSLAGAATKATNQVLEDRAAALVTEIRSASGDGVLTVPTSELDPGVAVYNDTGERIAGSIPPAMEDVFAGLSTTTSVEVLNDVHDRWGIRAEPFSTTAGLHGVVIVAEPYDPYEHNERAALAVSIVAGVLLVAMAAGSAAWISRRVLSPVRQMAQTADEWSEHDLDRRFDLGAPTNEIRALGQTLDGLLDKVAGVITAEQRLTSELAHELRTPLTAIHGITELLSMRTDLDAEAQEDLAQIERATSAMSQTITDLLQLARRDGPARQAERTPLTAIAAQLRDQPLPADATITLVDDLRDPRLGALALSVPAALAVRALAPVVSNALTLTGAAEVRARLRDRTVELLVLDSGSGLDVEDTERLFDPGFSASGGSGLGLALARRVARSGGGDVTVAERHNEYGGATFAITFPGSATR